MGVVVEVFSAHDFNSVDCSSLMLTTFFTSANEVSFLIAVQIDPTIGAAAAASPVASLPISPNLALRLSIRPWIDCISFNRAFCFSRAKVALSACCFKRFCSSPSLSVLTPAACNELFNLFKVLCCFSCLSVNLPNLPLARL